ncbi:MAG: SMC-Scp complex subunit ScpB [Ruminococcaceae bacterium]|nr:SMC-Scp complex subunit ScpB [Oscillospiraceae bacterium]
MEIRDIEAAIEGILFAAGEPVDLGRIAAVLALEKNEVSDIVDRIADRLNCPESGIRLVRMENSAQLCSAPEYADIIRMVLEERKPPKLSKSCLEVLAITAYYQPVTKAVIEQIRGVDSDYSVKVLCDRGFIQQQGRLNVPGRPVLYGTTKDFLRVFGISSIDQLPELPGTETDAEGQMKLADAIEKLKAERITEE